MPSRIDYPIPPPTTWESFENLCRDLWAEIWQDENTQKNGRQRQPQHGVDVFGKLKKGGWGGVQSKEKGHLPAKTISVSELRDEVKKAKEFEPKLKEYIVATTGPRDEKVQTEARKITDSNSKRQLFSVTVQSWEDIEILLKKYKDVYKRHYPQHFPDIEAAEELTKEVKNTIEQGFEKSSDEIGGLKYEFQKGFQNLSEQISIGGDVTQEHQAEIDFAKKLIDQHKPTTAIEYLTPIKERIWESTSNSVRFRILTNIAAANLQLGKDKEGARLFIEAYQYNPDDEKSLCNMALAYILLDNPEKAKEYITKVLSKNPSSGRAYSLLVQILADAKTPYENILKKIPSEYLDLPEICYALGTVCRRNQKFEEALDWYKKAKTTKSSSEYLVAEATTLLASISRNMNISFSKKLTKSEVQKVKEAAEIFEQAWTEIKVHEDKDLKIECLVNNGIANMILGNFDKAAVAFDDALTLEPDNNSHQFNRAYVDYETGKKPLALKRLMNLKDCPDLPASILIGEIYLTENKDNPETIKNEAIPIIENFISLNPSDFFKSAAERLLVQIYITLNELDNAKDLVDKLSKASPNDANTLVSKSRVYRLLGDDNKADEALSKAESLINKDSNYFDILAVADEDYYVDKFNDAAKLYERITDSTVDNEITRRLIDSYLKAGNNQKVLQICQSIRTNQGLVRNIVKLEISLHEDIGDLVTAKKLCEEFLDTNPTDVGMELHLARIHYRAQELDEVDKFLKKPVDYEMLSMEQWIFYGELLSVRGLNKEAIVVIYEARRKFFDRSEAHLQYVNTFLRSEKGLDEWLHPEEVSIDAAVSLEENNIKTWYVVEDRDDADFAKNELNPKNPLCKKLLGKKAGDEIELVTTGPQKRNGKIAEIRSKYVLAFQNSMSSYQTMFPDAEGLYRIDLKTSSEEQVNEDDLKIIFEQIDKQHERDSKIVEFYKDGKLTIGAFSKLLGKNPIEAWGLLMGEKSPGIRCSTGDGNLRTASQVALKENPKIVIDILSILTIHGIEQADLLVTTLGKPLIAQSTIDVITELLTNRKGLYDEKGFMTMGKQGNQYVREEITAEQIGKNSDYLKGILDWIKNNCIITPCHEALKMDSDKREKLYDLFGVSFIDSMLIAKQENALLYSEDERLRTYATTAYKVQGAWTQTILEHLLNTGAINNDQYQEAIIKLVNSKYSFISINADTLITATKKSNWKPDNSFLKLASLLDGKNCDTAPAVIVVSHYIEQLLNQPIFLDDPKNLCFVILDNATMNRENKRQFVRNLEIRVRQLLRFSPTKIKDFNQILNSWLKLQIF